MENSALIVCNGAPPRVSLLKKLWGEVRLRLCADGGANFVCAHDLIPDQVIGDMDSISNESIRRIGEDRLIRVNEQDTNDADKTIRYCLENKIEQVHLLGVAGRRCDQFLANLELLYKYALELKIVLWTDLEKMEVVENTWEESMPVGTTVSLLPLFGKVDGITTEGLAFPLTGQSLELGKAPTGVSNQSDASTVRISVEAGKLLVVVRCF